MNEPIEYSVGERVMLREPEVSGWASGRARRFARVRSVDEKHMPVRYLLEMEADQQLFRCTAAELHRITPPPLPANVLRYRPRVTLPLASQRRGLHSTR